MNLVLARIDACTLSVKRLKPVRLDLLPVNIVAISVAAYRRNL